jgi:hypothetical protein
MARLLPCGHMYHQECVDQVRNQSCTCDCCVLWYIIDSDFGRITCALVLPCLSHSKRFAVSSVVILLPKCC